MKRLVFATIIAAIVIALLGGCAAQGLKDGTYYAEDKEFDKNGWKSIVTVVVKDGKIANVFFDQVNKDGLLKNFQQDYAVRMKEKSGTTPLEATMKLEKSLLAKQKPEAVDAVSGATGTVEAFKKVVAEALKGAPVAAKGGFKDGLYKAMEEDFDSHGWKAMAAVVIKDGKIQRAFFDEINKQDGHYKLSDAEYAKNMEAKSGTTPAKATEEAVKSLLAKQDPKQVDAVSGATGTIEKFKTLMTKALSFAK